MNWNYLYIGLIFTFYLCTKALLPWFIHLSGEDLLSHQFPYNFFFLNILTNLLSFLYAWSEKNWNIHKYTTTLEPFSLFPRTRYKCKSFWPLSAEEEEEWFTRAMCMLGGIALSVQDILNFMLLRQLLGSYVMILYTPRSLISTIVQAMCLTSFKSISLNEWLSQFMITGISILWALIQSIENEAADGESIIWWIILPLLTVQFIVMAIIDLTQEYVLYRMICPSQNEKRVQQMFFSELGFNFIFWFMFTPLTPNMPWVGQLNWNLLPIIFLSVCMDQLTCKLTIVSGYMMKLIADCLAMLILMWIEMATGDLVFHPLSFVATLILSLALFQYIWISKLSTSNSSSSSLIYNPNQVNK